MSDIKKICEILLDGDELVIRGPDDLEYRDVLFESVEDLDVKRIYYALLHDFII